MTPDTHVPAVTSSADPYAGFPGEAFLEQLLSSDHLIVALKDREGRYLRVSRLLERIWGGLGVDIIGKTAREALPPGIGDVIHRDDCAVLQSQQASVYEQTFPLHGNDRTFRSRTVPRPGRWRRAARSARSGRCARRRSC